MKNLYTNLKSSRAVIILAMAALGAAQSDARQLTPDEALASVSSAHGAIKKAPGSSIDLAYTATSDGLNTVYVFSSKQGGYMVVAADDVSTPLLGYADSGSFDADAMPPAMKAWLEEYSAQIAAAATLGGAVSGAAPMASYSSISPIVTTMWNQDSPYNDQCPTVSGQPTYTGCVATAMAQVMNTYRWPEKGTGTNSYEWNNTTLTMDFSKVTFDWDNLISNYSVGKGTTAQRNAVATLMHACGMAADMNYGINASGASPINAAIGLMTYLGYDKGLRYAIRKYYSLNDWVGMLYDELRQGYPIYYDGQSNDGGHAFVIDGYSAADGLFHVNWGWGGMSNGYFMITTLDPGQQGIGGSSSGYCNGQGAILGLRKPVEGSTLYPNFLQQGDLDVQKSVVQRNASDPVMVLLGKDHATWSYSLGAITTEMGLKLVSENRSTEYVWWAYGPLEIPSMSGFTFAPIYASEFPESGTYRATPVYRVDGKIYETPVEVGCCNALMVTATPETLTFSQVESKYNLSVSDITPVYALYTGKKALISASISNRGDEYYNNISARLLSGTSTLATFPATMVDIPDGSTTDVIFEATLPASVSAGSYQVAVYDCNDKMIGSPANVTVKTPPSGTPAITVTNVSYPVSAGGNGTQSSPAQLWGDDIHIEATVNCTQGYFDSPVKAFFFPMSGSSSSINLSANIRPLVAGESERVEWTGDLNGQLEVGVPYMMIFFMQNSTGYTQLNGFHYVTLIATTGITDVTAGVPDTGVYPNPATTDITVTAASAITNVAVYSPAGLKAIDKSFDGTTESISMSVDMLAPGNYIVIVSTVDGHKAERLIKR